MINLNRHGELTKERDLLKHALGNISQTIDVLKQITTSDAVDLLFYDAEKKYFCDKTNSYTLSLDFLEGEVTSMIAKAYQSKIIYHSLHTLYDKDFNISLDNPFKISLSAQIIMPILQGDEIIGIARFSKHKYIYEKIIIKRLRALEESLVDIFLPETYIKAEKFNSTLFSLNKNEVYDTLDALNAGIEKLLRHSHAPEIKKLLEGTQESVDSICQYVKPCQLKDLDDTPPTTQEPTAIRILIADDIQINVKILKAMIAVDNTFEVLHALDGIETIEKIDNLHGDKKYIHILFLDHHMPGKLGLEVAKYIRDKERSSQNHQMIIVSITNDPEAISNNEQLYDYHVSKPFIKSHVKDVIGQIKEQLSM